MALFIILVRISLSQNGICEPSTTEKISEYEIQASLIKLELPDFFFFFFLHYQSIERAVELISEVCHIVYRFESRHRHILQKLCHHLRPSFISKGSYTENYDDIII